MSPPSNCYAARRYFKIYSTFKYNQNRMALRSPTACEELEVRTVHRGRHSKCNTLSCVEKMSFTFRQLWRKRQREREIKRLLGNKSNISPWVCSGIRKGAVENSLTLAHCAPSQGVRFRYTVSKKWDTNFSVTKRCTPEDRSPQTSFPSSVLLYIHPDLKLNFFPFCALHLHSPRTRNTWVSTFHILTFFGPCIVV